MFGLRTSRWLVVAALALPLGLSVSACGGSEGPKTARVQAGEMPAGGEWSGVYYNPVYGYLHLVSEGNTINGAWRTAAGDAWGEMSGETDGNLFKYQWTEHKIGMVGPSASSKGKGYFVYKIPKQGEAHEIHGEWGLNDNETGHDWKGIKQTNMPPDPKSVRPDEIEGRVNAGGWDDSGGSPPSEDSTGGGDSGGDKGSDGDDKGGGSLPDPMD